MMYVKGLFPLCFFSQHWQPKAREPPLWHTRVALRPSSSRRVASGPKKCIFECLNQTFLLCVFSSSCLISHTCTQPAAATLAALHGRNTTPNYWSAACEVSFAQENHRPSLISICSLITLDEGFIFSQQDLVRTEFNHHCFIHTTHHLMYLYGLVIKCS